MLAQIKVATAELFESAPYSEITLTPIEEKLGWNFKCQSGCGLSGNNGSKAPALWFASKVCFCFFESYVLIWALPCVVIIAGKISS